MYLCNAHALTDELTRLVETGPGHCPAGRARVSEICSELSRTSHGDDGLSAALADVRRMFDFWFSARMWRLFDQNGACARSILERDIETVRGALAGRLWVGSVAA